MLWSLSKDWSSCSPDCSCPHHGPKGKKIWLRPPWKSYPKGVLKTVALNWSYHWRELTFVKTHVQLSEAFLLKDVCYSLTFSHVFSISPHHQGGCRQLWTRSGERAGPMGARNLRPLAGDRRHNCKLWPKKKPHSGAGEAASAVCPLPKGKGMAATTPVVRLQCAPEEQSHTVLRGQARCAVCYIAN